MTSFPACHDNMSNRLSPGVIFWFRNDLRLHDQVALAHAIDIAHRLGGWLLPVYIHDNRLDAMTPWGVENHLKLTQSFHLKLTHPVTA